MAEYCEEARRAFRSLTPEELREFLRTVILNIVFEGREIRIQGHLPTAVSPPQLSEPSPGGDVPRSLMPNTKDFTIQPSAQTTRAFRTKEVAATGIS